MKLKNLRKKIRRLEKRLQEGPKKLAKLKRNLEAMEALKAKEARGKSAAHARAALQTAESSTPIVTQPHAKTVKAKKPDAVKKAKRKLKLSPERRAQLAAAMKARWAAKRAAAEKIPTIPVADQPVTLERMPKALKSRHGGALK